MSEGKGKSRAENFSHLPSPPESAPSTAPNTRPVSQDQAQSGPHTVDGTLSADDAKDHSAAITDPDDSEAVTGKGAAVLVAGQSGSGPVTDQSDPTPNSAQDTPPQVNYQETYDCGCKSIYDDTGKKRQLACEHHKFNPFGSVLSLPKKRPLSETTNLRGRDLSVYTPQAKRDVGSPDQPPVVTPTKGRNFVQGSKNGPTFLDSFNSERAIEPTGPPNTLTTTPTAEMEEMPPKRNTSSRVSKSKVLGRKTSDPVTAQSTPDPPQIREAASRSQGTEPQKQDAIESQDLGSHENSATEPTQDALEEGQDLKSNENPATEPKQDAMDDGQDLSSDGNPANEPKQDVMDDGDDMKSNENTATGPKQSEDSGDNDNAGDRNVDKSHLQFTGVEDDEPAVPLSVPAHRNENVQPKSILKKTPGAAEQAEREKLRLAQTSRGAKLFQQTVGNLKNKFTTAVPPVTGPPNQAARSSDEYELVRPSSVRPSSAPPSYAPPSGAPFGGRPFSGRPFSVRPSGARPVNGWHDDSSDDEGNGCLNCMAATRRTFCDCVRRGLL